MSDTLTKPLAELCAELGITASVKELDTYAIKKPNWAKQAWSITLKYQGKRAQFRFYGGGSANTPTATDLVWSISLDSSALDEGFNEWCMEYGYSNDSLEALGIYSACKRNASRFTKLIGNDEVFNQLVESARDY